MGGKTPQNLNFNRYQIIKTYPSNKLCNKDCDKVQQQLIFSYTHLDFASYLKMLKGKLYKSLTFFCNSWFNNSYHSNY